MDWEVSPRQRPVPALLLGGIDDAPAARWRSVIAHLGCGGG